MLNEGTALMGMGTASGEDRAKEATKAAMESPLLEASIDGATGVLFNVIGGEDLAMFEIDEIARMISEAVHPEANVFFGANVDPDMEEQLQVTVLATGFDTDNQGVPVPSSNYTFNTPSTEEDEIEPPNRPEARQRTGLFSDDSDESDDDLDTPSFLRRKKEY